jgi:hypothetical protein
MMFAALAVHHIVSKTIRQCKEGHSSACDIWRTFWRILAVSDENFLVATVHFF